MMHWAAVNRRRENCSLAARIVQDKSAGIYSHVYLELRDFGAPSAKHPLVRKHPRGSRARAEHMIYWEKFRGSCGTKSESRYRLSPVKLSIGPRTIGKRRDGDAQLCK